MLAVGAGARIEGEVRLLVGGYTAESDGRASGIGVLHAGAADDVLAGGPLSRRADAVAIGGSPSWVTRHPTLDVVYAALEGTGEVRAFRRTGAESYAPLGMRREAGELVCHVAVAPDGSSLVASCWGDGRVVRLPLDSQGAPLAPAIAPPAEDPYAPSPVPRDSSGATRQPAWPAVSAHQSSLAGGGVDAGDLAAAARALREAVGAEYAHLVPGASDQDETLDPAVVRALREAGGAEYARLALGARDLPSPTDGSSALLIPGEPDAQDAADPPADRVSRAHQSVFLPGGLVATTDMGFDLVRFWRVSGDRLVERGRVVLPRGSGPRHMVWHPSGHLYVVTELSHEVFVIAADSSGAWRLFAGAQLSPAVLPDDTAAELAASRDGAFLYAGVRGSDTIAVLRVRGSGAELSPIALVEAGVTWPRHHVVLRDTLLVAGQRSDEVASLAIDQRTGVPGRVRHRVETPSPSCLVPLLT